MIIHNEDVTEIEAGIPEEHRHIRTIIRLQDGREITLQEATMANLVRAYISIKTHPTRTRIRLIGKRVESRKEEYAEWQLLEEGQEDLS